MRKTIDNIFTILIAVSLSCSCCSESAETSSFKDGREILLSVGMHDVVSRGAVDIQSEYFDANEKIDVFISASTATYPQPIVFTTTTAVNKENNLVDPKVKAGDDYSTYPPYWPADDGIPTDAITIYAYYPHNKILTLEYNHTFTVQSDQGSVANYKESDLMLGTPTSQGILRTAPGVRVPLTFNHLLSKIIVTIQADASFNSDQITANNMLVGATVRLLNVYPTIGITERKPLNETVGSATGTRGTVTLGTITASGDNTTEHVTSGDASTPWQLCAIVPPQAFIKGSKLIQIEMPDHSSLYYALQLSATDAEAQCLSGKVNTYHVTVNKSTISVQAEINDWMSSGSNTLIEAKM